MQLADLRLAEDRLLGAHLLEESRGDDAPSQNTPDDPLASGEPIVEVLEDLEEIVETSKTDEEDLLTSTSAGSYIEDAQDHAVPKTNDSFLPPQVPQDFKIMTIGHLGNTFLQT